MMKNIEYSLLLEELYSSLAKTVDEGLVLAEMEKLAAELNIRLRVSHGGFDFPDVDNDIMSFFIITLVRRFSDTLGVPDRFFGDIINKSSINLRIGLGEIRQGGKTALICYPESIIREKSDKYIILEIGCTHEKSNLSAISRIFNTPEEKIRTLLPPGSSKVIATHGIKVKV